MIVLMRKETNKIKDSIWKELLNAIKELQLTQYFEFNNSEFRATCTINGTEFKCLGLDDSEKIKGFAEMSDAYLDEATAFTQDDYELIDGTLRSKKYKLPLQLISSFNPISKVNWVYKYFGFDTNIYPKGYMIHHSTYLDNDRIDESYRVRMEELKVRNPVRYKIEALGEFASLDKLVYTNWKVEEFDYKQLKGVHCIGLDFGFTNDPTALISFIVDKSGRKIYIFDEYYETGKTNDQIAAVIKLKGYAKSEIVADAAEPKSIEEIKKHGISRIRSSVKGADSINHGIQYISNYDIIVLPKCENTITELENYSYKKDKHTNEYTNIPIDSFNHLLDALRYGIQIVNNNKDMKVGSKARLGL